jgi:hypothetical protein
MLRSLMCVCVRACTHAMDSGLITMIFSITERVAIVYLYVEPKMFTETVAVFAEKYVNSPVTSKHTIPNFMTRWTETACVLDKQPARLRHLRTRHPLPQFKHNNSLYVCHPVVLNIITKETKFRQHDQ